MSLQISYTGVGSIYTDNKYQDFEKIVEKMDWVNLPTKNLPFSQGEGLRVIIEEWKIPAIAVSWNNVFCEYTLLGIETNKQRIFFLDTGVEAVPLGLYTKHLQMCEIQKAHSEKERNL